MSSERFDARLMETPYETTVGTVTTHDHAAGATVLLVEVAGDLEDRAEDEPLEVVRGWIRISPPQLPDVDPTPPFVVAYYDWAGEDEAQEYVVLAAGLPVAVPVGSQVDVWAGDPAVAVTNVPVTVWEALVMGDDEDTDAEPLTVTVHPDLLDTIGSVDALAADTPVLIETLESYDVSGESDGDDELYLTQVLGGDLVRDGSFIDETTLPIPEGVVVMPVSPPASSPIPEVLPFPGGALYVRFGTVADASSYRLHVSTSNASAPSSSTQASPNAASPSIVRTLADGSPFPTVTSNPQQPMVYVAIVAANSVGPAPASAWVGARPGQVDPAFLQLLVGTLIAQRLFGETVEGLNINGGTVTGGLVRTAVDGQRWELGRAAAGNRNQLLAYSGRSGETAPGGLSVTYDTNLGEWQVQVDSPKIAGSVTGAFLVATRPNGSTRAAIQASIVELPTITTGNAGTGLFFTDLRDRVRAFILGSTLDAGTFRDGVDGRVGSLAPTVTMTTGSAGTGNFFTDVRDRITSYIQGLVDSASSLRASIVSAARDDSGFLNLPLASGFSNPTNPARTSTYRRQNGTVSLDVAVAGSIGTANTTVATVPANFRPSKDIGPIPASAGAPGGGVVHAFVLTTGVVQFRGAAAVTQGYMQITYPL